MPDQHTAEDGITISRRRLFAPGRCATCHRRLPGVAFILREPADSPEPRGLWRVCADCRDAVRTELRRAALSTPARLRIAIAMVASEHEATPLLPFWENLDDRGLERLLIAVVWIAFAVHAFAFILVVAVIASQPH